MLYWDKVVALMRAASGRNGWKRKTRGRRWS